MLCITASVELYIKSVATKFKPDGSHETNR
jgi:hypothetical protein